MFIDEAVITASKYHDFLRVTLPYTMQQVKRIDRRHERSAIRRPDSGIVPRVWGQVHVDRTFSIYRGARFAKGKAINKGLDQCHRRGWVLTMDADIILPAAHLVGPGQN